MTPTTTTTATPVTKAARTRRWQILTAALACGYLYIGVSSPLPSIRWPSLAGALVVLAALWLATRSHPIALTSLAAGALLPALADWSTLLIPATGLLILVCGTLAVRGTPAANGLSGSEGRTVDAGIARTRS